jgi:serine/threonine protein kinase
MDYPPILDTKFKVKGPLRCDGVGGMLLAEVEGGDRVAVRWFSPGTGGPDAVEALKKLPLHASLPSLITFGQEAACDWAAVDYPDGELLDVRKLTPETLKIVAGQLAGALAALHALDVVHGELCADSVILDSSNHPLMFDVPAAVANRATDRRGERSALAMLSRTAAFFSPERAKGAPPSKESDIYALGALLCGESQTASALERLHQIATGELKLQAPEPIREIVEKMVAADPKARPTAAEVVATLTVAPVADPFEALLEQEEVSAKGMAPGHEPTIQDISRPTDPEMKVIAPKVPAPVAPAAPAPRIEVKSVEIKPGDFVTIQEKFDPAKLLEVTAPEVKPPVDAPSLPPPLPTAPPDRERKSGSKAALRKSGPKPALGPIPEIEARPTAPSAVRRALPLTSAAPLRKHELALGWFAANNRRLGALAGTAAFCFFITLTALGEYHSRRSEIEELLHKPNPVQEARERQKRLVDDPPRPANAADLRKATEEADDAY